LTQKKNLASTNREVGIVLKKQISDKQKRLQEEAEIRKAQLICYPPCNEPTREELRKMERLE
jgi:hypothetical protein